MVAHRPGLNSQPSRALENRTVLTFDSGGAVNGGTSDTAGAGTQVQVLPPLTVLRNSALHGRTLQRRVPSTNPVRADTKLAEAASNPFGGGGFPLAGCAEALPAPSAASTARTAASTTARPNDTLMDESPSLRAPQVVLQPAHSYDAPGRPLVGPEFRADLNPIMAPAVIFSKGALAAGPAQQEPRSSGVRFAGASGTLGRC